MKRRNIYLTDRTWFEDGAHKDPVNVLDHKLEFLYPEFYSLNYDLKLLVSKEASKEEKDSWFYNDSIEKSGTFEISSFDIAVKDSDSKSVLLIGFTQEIFEHLIPQIEDTVEVLYLFKCPKINDLAMLSKCRKLKCLHVFWNNSLEKLWDMTENRELKVLSFLSVMKLKSIKALELSNIEYVTLDSSDNSGNKKEIEFDIALFEKMVRLKHLRLIYKDTSVDY